MKNLISALTLAFILFNSSQIFSQDSTSVNNVDPKVVLEKYITAIGGRDVFSKIEDRTTIMRGTGMGQSITFVVKQKAPNKLRQEVKAGGMNQVVIFDGEKAVMTVMDKKVEIKDKELDALKVEASLGFMLDPEKYGAKLSYEGIEKIKDKDAYKIKMVLPAGMNWISFYDVESGLKVEDQREIESPKGTYIQTIDYDDYKDVDGMKYPFKIVQTFGGQSVDVTVTSIKVNKGLSDDIFVIAE